MNIQSLLGGVWFGPVLCVLLVGGSGSVRAAGGEDCRALDARRRHYEGHVNLGDTHYKLARGFVKDRLFNLAATNLVMAYKHAYIADLEGKSDQYLERAPRITNYFWGATVNESITLLQNRHRSVQRDIQKLLGKLEVLRNSPGLEGLVKDYLDRIIETSKTADTPQRAANALIELAKGVERPDVDPDPLKEFTQAMDSGNHAGAVGVALANQDKLSKELENQLQRGKNPLSAADASAAVKAFYARDVKTLLDLLKKYPDNPWLKEMVIQLLREMGMSREDAENLVGSHRTGDAPGLRRVGDQYPNVPAVQDLVNRLIEAIKPGGGGGQGGGGRGDMPTSKDRLVDSGGKPMDQHVLKRYFNEDGSARGGATDVDYIGKEGGQINYEQKVKFVYKRGGQSGTFVVDEVKGDRIDWALQIKEAERNKDGQTWHVTYKVQNLNPGAAGLTISKWVLTDPSGQAKSGTGDQFKVDVTGSGSYTIEAHGKTEWGSPFIITESPTF
jgi:hypothetical protein